MIPASFEQSNHVFSAPLGMESEVEPLSVFTDGEKIISCWKLTKSELEEINKTGKVWLWIWGRGMPPVSVEVRNPFISERSEGE